MPLTQKRITKGLLVVLGMILGVSSVRAAHPITDITQDALAVVENSNVLKQSIQLFESGAVARSIYTAQGDFRTLGNNWGSILTFDWAMDSGLRQAFAPVLDDEDLTVALSGDLGVVGAARGFNVTNLRRKVEKTLMLPINISDITARELQAIKLEQRRKTRAATLDNYSLGLSVQVDATNFEKEKIPAIRQMAQKTENLTEAVVVQSEGLNLIASQININNLLKAAALELQSIEVMKMVDG